MYGYVIIFFDPIDRVSMWLKAMIVQQIVSKDIGKQSAYLQGDPRAQRLFDAVYDCLG